MEIEENLAILEQYLDVIEKHGRNSIESSEFREEHKDDPVLKDVLNRIQTLETRQKYNDRVQFIGQIIQYMAAMIWVAITIIIFCKLL